MSQLITYILNNKKTTALVLLGACVALLLCVLFASPKGDAGSEENVSGRDIRRIERENKQLEEEIKTIQADNERYRENIRKDSAVYSAMLEKVKVQEKKVMDNAKSIEKINRKYEKLTRIDGYGDDSIFIHLSNIPIIP